MKKKWIRLFCYLDRARLEEELNRFINEYHECDIQVWTDKYGSWLAQVRYCYGESPTYSKEDKENGNEI